MGGHIFRMWRGGPERLPIRGGSRSRVTVVECFPNGFVWTPMVVFVLGIETGDIAVENAHVEQREHVSRLPEVGLALCDQLTRQAVHRPFGEFHPPDSIKSLVLCANRTVGAPEVLHLVIRRR